MANMKNNQLSITNFALINHVPLPIIVAKTRRLLHSFTFNRIVNCRVPLGLCIIFTQGRSDHIAIAKQANNVCYLDSHMGNCWVRRQVPLKTIAEER